MAPGPWTSPAIAPCFRLGDGARAHRRNVRDPASRGDIGRRAAVEPAPCPDFPVPELARARCGYLVVRENRARPTGRTIRLIVAILPAASPRPGTEPVVHLASGPGGIGIGGAICSDYNAFGRDEPVGRRAFPAFPASIQRQLVGSFAYVIEDCAQVRRVPSGSPAIRRPPGADIPTLLVSGTFDSVTSVRWSKLAAQDLKNATVIQILGVGHGVTPHSACAQDVVASFLAHPNAPDTSCVPKQTMPPFA